MTVRCDACGTENRDKAMFCRGCAGKLPAFATTKKSSSGASDVRHAGASPVTPTTSPNVQRSSPSAMSTGLLSGPSFGRSAMIAMLLVLFVTSLAWVAWLATDAPPPPGQPVGKTASSEGRLPPEASLSKGETLDDGPQPDATTQAITPSLPEPAHSLPTVEAPSASSTSESMSLANSSPATPTAPGLDPLSPGRGTRRAATTPPGSGRTSDPRVGCEHLFFAFAARCEANHCQQPAYARHPRCDAVREQQKRDDARRNQMPGS